MDRVPGADGAWQALVVLKLRALAPDGHVLVDEIYHDEEAAGSSIRAVVDAYGTAIDRIFARFQADLRAGHGAGDAG